MPADFGPKAFLLQDGETNGLPALEPTAAQTATRRMVASAAACSTRKGIVARPSSLKYAAPGEFSNNDSPAAPDRRNLKATTAVSTNAAGNSLLSISETTVRPDAPRSVSQHAHPAGEECIIELLHGYAAVHRILVFLGAQLQALVPAVLPDWHTRDGLSCLGFHVGWSDVAESGMEAVGVIEAFDIGE